MSNRVVVKLCDQCEEHWVPRAVVAISEDRQWLVVLNPEPFGWGEDQQSLWWSTYHWDSESMLWAYEYPPGDRRVTSRGIRDTGQDAHEVLREFLEGREG